MSTTELLREQVKKQLDAAGDTALRMVQSILEIAQESGSKEADYYPNWDGLPQEIKDDIEESIKELDAGKGIPHSEVVKKNPGLWLR